MPTQEHSFSANENKDASAFDTIENTLPPLNEASPVPATLPSQDTVANDERSSKRTSHNTSQALNASTAQVVTPAAASSFDKAHGFHEEHERSRWFYPAIAVAVALLAFSATALWLAFGRTSNPTAMTPGQTAKAPQPRAEASPVNSSTLPPAVDATSKPVQVQSESEKDARANLQASLNGWLAATNARDLNRQLEFYAPTVNAFYLKRNVPLAAVREEKARLIQNARTIDVRISEPVWEIGSDGRSASARFRKSWNFTGATASNGQVLQELRWTKTDAGWKINSERDLQVLH